MRGNQFEDIYWNITNDDWAIPRWVMVKYGQAIAERAWNEGYQEAYDNAIDDTWNSVNPYEEKK